MIRRLDRYELLEQVGSGGMAVVYRGRDSALDREVAVKLLHPHLAARAESRARFSREARAVARLNHPNIVEIYDYAGDAALESYLVTEFVRGRTLRVFAEEEGLGFPEVGALLARVLADALVHAHAAGVIHRDLKPENVLVLESGRRRAVKLVDFGIARILTSDDRMTMTGALVGSPNHMAPEIIEGREADARSDVFSLGTILYWLCTGVLPFAAPNPTATLRRVIEGDFTDARALAPQITDSLAAVVARAMAVDPAQRTPTAAAFRDDLDAALAEAGLADPRAEADAFLSGPGPYKAELRGRLVAHALAEADRALACGETARALKHLDRVLAMDPGDAQVAARLARVARGARRRRAARIAAWSTAVAGAAAAAWLGISAWSRRTERPPLASQPESEAAPPVVAPGPPPPRPAPEPAPPPAHAPAADPSVAAAPPEPAAAAPAPTAPGGRARPDPQRRPPPTAPASTRLAAGAAPGTRPANATPSPDQAAAARPATVLTVHVSPYAQRALLDGVEVARGENLVTFRLVPGAPHRVQIEHACCFPFVKEFAADEAVPAELKERLRPRPARLRVEGDPQALLYVDGKLVGTAGDSQRSPLEVTVPASGPSPYEAPAELRLERPGQPTVRATVRLRAGAEVTFAATGATGAAEPARAGATP